MLILFGIGMLFALYWWFSPQPRNLYQNIPLRTNVVLVIGVAAVAFAISRFVLRWIVLDSSFMEIRLVFTFGVVGFLFMALRYLFTVNMSTEKLAIAQEAIDLQEDNMLVKARLGETRDELEKEAGELAGKLAVVDEENEQIKARFGELEQQQQKFSHAQQLEEQQLKSRQEHLAGLEDQLRKHYMDKEIQLAKFHEENFAMKADELQRLYDQQQESYKSDLRREYDTRLKDFKSDLHEKMQDRMMEEKQHIVENIYRFDQEEADEIFEIKRTQETMRKQAEELERRKHLLEVGEKVSSANSFALDAKRTSTDIQSENTDLRADLRLVQSDIEHGFLAQKLHREKEIKALEHQLQIEEERRKSDKEILSGQMQIQDERAKGRLADVQHTLHNYIKDVEMASATMFQQAEKSMSDMKLHFGQEINRIDTQQDKILNELERYYLKNQEFVNQCKTLSLEAKRHSMDTEDYINQSKNLYEKHRIEAQDIENKIQHSIQDLSVKEGHLANQVGRTMLDIQRATDERATAFREIHLEKKDINLLHREKNIEHDMNLQEIRHQKQGLGQMKEMLRSDAENRRLQHQSYMTEQRYMNALDKANRSGSLLTRLGRMYDANKN